MTKDIDNIINVTDVASKGVVFDTPPVALAPNIMTNVRNVRFKSGAIRKMEGELLLTDLELDDDVPTGYKLGDVQYFAVWEEPSISPTQCYYITVRDFLDKNNNDVIKGQKVFIQNAIKSTDVGYLRRDITPPIGTELDTTTGLTATQAVVGSTTITVSANTGIQVGYYVEAVGIPVGTRVTEINGTDITIDKGTDEVLSSTAIAFKLYSGFSVSYDKWGHTLFGGGFAFVLNNGVDRPYHIKLNPEDSAITDIELLRLPGWDDYFGQEETITDVWSADSALVPVFAIGQEVDFESNSLLVKKITGGVTTVLEPEAGTPAGSNPPPSGSTPPTQSNDYRIPSNFVPGAYPGDSNLITITSGGYQIYYNEDTGITVLHIGGLVEDDEIEIQVRTRNPVRVSCGIIEAFGNLLVAGNLKTTDSLNPSITLKRDPGVISISDVALTGGFPTNWNPFASSVSTAERYTLSETSAIKDMKTLQSNFYIYSTEGIHQIRLTGNTNTPVSFSSVTETYGAMTNKAVAEYDGRHFVVGKNDIYSFTGNPADIKSLCDSRTRTYFYNNLNPSYLDNLFVLENHRLNEIWINYPTIQSTNGNCDEALIYNYRDNTWTIRDLDEVKAGDIGPIVGGGIPEATLALTGNSGNAGYTNIGNAQVQTTVFATDPAPTTLSQRWWTLKAHDDIKVRYDFLIGPNFTPDTRSARQVIHFSWFPGDASTGGSGYPYSSSGTDVNGNVKSLTWVIYTTDATIGVTLTPGLTTLADILDDIVDKMNNQTPTVFSPYPAFKTKYFAYRELHGIRIVAESTGPRAVFPITSSGSATVPANGVFYYSQGTNSTTGTYRDDQPEFSRYSPSLLTGAYFPVPNTINQDIAGTTVSGKPEITGSLTLKGVGLNSDAVYPLYFDGYISYLTLTSKISYFINIRYPDRGYSVPGGSVWNPPPSFTGKYIFADDSGTISGNTAPVFTVDNTTVLPPAKVLCQFVRNGRAAGTADTITFNFPLGESFTTTLSTGTYIPDSTSTTESTEEVTSNVIMAKIRDDYNASFGGPGQPIKYFIPTTSQAIFAMDWARPPSAAGRNVDPITWSVTPGTARAGYTYPILSGNIDANGTSYPATLFGDSVANLITTNIGAPPAYSTLTRATLKIINNGVSTTVLDKRYGEGPGRLVLEPLSGIDGAGESRYGDTDPNTITNDAQYLALYYDASTTDNDPNGVAVSSENILLDVVTALAPYTDNLSVVPNDSVNPTSVVIKPLQYSSTSNYVESFVVSTGSEAQTAPVGSTFHSANRDGTTIAGTDSTLASTSTVNTTLSNTRPWSLSEVNDLKKFPLFVQSDGASNRLRAADLGFDFAGTKYVSFFERDQLSITTTFNTETINSMVLWADGATREDVTNNLLRATLHIRTRGTNASGTESLLTNTDPNDAKLITNSFVVATDYKVDARVQGRFINYRIDDAALDYSPANDREWHISGLQLEILKGGTR